MPKVTKSSLQPGDIVLFEWFDTFWHTAIYIGAAAQLEDGIAHCQASRGTEIVSIAKDYGEAKNVYAFRIPNTHANALPNVLALAHNWATVTTGYGTPRGSGVLKQYDRSNPGTTPPFQYDALFRVFKWLDGRERFSTTQGTTCCAFALACFQAGMMRWFLEQNQLTDWLEAILYKLRSERGHKREPSEEAAEQIFRGELTERKGAKVARLAPYNPVDYLKIRARLEYRNPGSKKKSYAGVDALWDEIKTDVCYLYENPTMLQDILTAPLLCDAKFTYSHTLYERLRLDGSWTEVH